jgi:F0F1-type ATP synthase beta subunit
MEVIMNMFTMPKTWVALVAAAFFATTLIPTIAVDNTEGIYKGSVQTVDLTKHKVGVVQGITTKTFTVDKTTSIITKEKPNGATLKDLRTGFNVEIKFTQENGSAVAVASVIKEIEKLTEANPESKPIPPAPAAASR